MDATASSPDRSDDTAERARRHIRIGELFAAASDLPVAERSDWLRAECGGDSALVDSVLALLQHDHESAVFGALDRAVAIDVGDTVGEHGGHPERIGPYRIIGLLGIGGMGTVYEAEQERPKRVVALKVLSAGFLTTNMLRRFEWEAEILGWLEHPGIARIFEAGTADSGSGAQPYFAMELVRGEPITRFAAAAKLGTRARLALVAAVCDAVHHAHQKGVIHRDLKPANVLVDGAGQPKVLDFGVARATDSDLRATTLATREGEIIGTLPYMSPEQVSGVPSAIDIRTDVYALGAITFELLTGTLPVDVRGSSLPHAVQAIMSEEPTRLGTVDRALRGDVETIVAKALEKDKERRYASARELAEDLRRHLGHEPIVARPPSSLYQLNKFARRNRVLVGGVAAVILALAAGLTASTALYLEAKDAREDEAFELRRALEAERLAVDEAASVEEVSEFMVELFRSAETNNDWGRSVTARELLDAGRLSIAGSLGDRPRIRSRLNEAMGRAYGNLGLFGNAEELLLASLAAQREIHGQADHADVARSLIRLGSLRALQADFPASEKRAIEAIEMTERIDPDHESLSELWYGLAATQLDQSRFEDAAESLARANSLASTDLLPPLQYLNVEAGIAWGRGDYDRTEELHRDILEMRQAELSPDDPRVVDALNNLGRTLVRRNRQREAEPLLRDALEIRERRLPEGHPDRLASMNNLGLVLLNLGEIEGAKELFGETLAQVRERFGSANPRTITALGNLAGASHTAGEFEAAERYFREALDAGRELGQEHTLLHAANLNGLALVIGMRKGQGVAAEKLLREALSIEEDIAPEDRDLRVNTLGNIAMALQVQGRQDEAVPILLEVLEINEELYGPSEPVASNLNNIAVAYARQGHLPEAIETLEECLAVLGDVFPKGHRSIGAVHSSLGVMLMEQGDLEAALVHLNEALGLRVDFLPAGHPEITDTRVACARCLLKMERFAEAEAPLRMAYDELEKAEVTSGSKLRSVRADLRAVAEALDRPERLERFFD